MVSRYTAAELDAFAIEDWRRDAEVSDQQAVAGPYYPEKGITAESLRAMAAACREKIKKYKNGGAHAAMLKHG